MNSLRKDPEIKPGMIYEDCSFHPVLCTELHDDESVSGISLIDGSYPRTCSTKSCGIVPLAIGDVIKIRRDFPAYIVRRKRELAEER
jgi:hypothetical protein